ncbi:MAG: MoaD/ThiS family protein [Promethearchaeota archaeon]
MKLRIKLFGKLGAHIGSDIELKFMKEDPTLREVLKMLIKKDPKLESVLLRGNTISRGTILLVNGHVVDKSEWGLDKVLSAQDRILIDHLGFLPIVGGGCLIRIRSKYR